VDGDPAQMALVGDSPGRAGFPAVGAVRSQEALEKVRVGSFQVILADCNLPGMDGLAFLERALQQGPGMHVSLKSADHSVDAAIEAIKHGAYDYLCKPLDYPRLTKAFDDLAEHPYPASARDMQRQRRARRAHVRHRPNESLPLPEKCGKAVRRSGWGVERRLIHPARESRQRSEHRRMCASALAFSCRRTCTTRYAAAMREATGLNPYAPGTPSAQANRLPSPSSRPHRRCRRPVQIPCRARRG
jgi:CheY-like chemotaxis protein